MSSDLMCPDDGTYSSKYKFRCLARHVCHLPGKAKRLAFMAEFAKSNGVAQMHRLQKQVLHEWPTRNKPITP